MQREDKMEVVVKEDEKSSGEHQFFHSYLLSSKCERREYKEGEHCSPIPWKDGNFDKNGFVKISDEGSTVSFKLQKGTYHTDGFNGCYPVQIISFVYQLYTFYAQNNWVADDILSGFYGVLDNSRRFSSMYKIDEDGSIVFKLQRGPIVDDTCNGGDPIAIIQFVWNHYNSFKNPDTYTSQIITDLRLAYHSALGAKQSTVDHPSVITHLENALLHDLLRSIKRFEGGTWGYGDSKLKK